MIIEIFADNLTKEDISKNIHRSARAIILREDSLLFLHTKTLDYYMLPGGGIEKDETPEQAVVREVLEETGFKSQIIKKTLIIKEYFPESTWETHYFLCSINEEEQVLPVFTSEEQDLKLEINYLTIPEALNILDNHDSNFIHAQNIMQREFIAIANSL
jgi:8-oxo-dGTP diphosphatase